MAQIEINGKIYPTFIDGEGTLRFQPNNLIHKMSIEFDLSITRIIKLYELGAITQMDLLDYYAGIGFVVSMAEELSFFENLEFNQSDK